MLQNLTTREPDLDQPAVAIRSLEEARQRGPRPGEEGRADRDRRPRIRRGELELEGGASPGFEVARMLAAVGFDDRLCDRQTEAAVEVAAAPGSVR